MKTVKRYDFVKSSGKAIKTEQGYLKVPVTATRVGVLTYKRGDGSIIRELRPHDEVFKPESMDTLKMVPVTNRHPTVLLDANNTKEFMCGMTSEIVEKRDIYLDTFAVITDGQTISEIENQGLREVSCGYQCELEETPGTFDGQAYDVIQRNIKYNHVAVVDKGRAGPNVRLHLDADDAILEPNNLNNQPKPKGDTMAKVMVNGVEYEASEALAGAIVSALEKAKSEVGAAQSAAQDAQKQSEGMKSEMDKTQAKADALEKENKELKEKVSKFDDKFILEQVKTRNQIETVARKVLPADTKFDDMSNAEMKKAVVAKQCPDVKLDEKSEAYIEARFDHVAETVSKETTGNGNALTDAAKRLAQSRNDGAGQETPADIRAKSMKADSEAWKQPLSANKEKLFSKTVN